MKKLLFSLALVPVLGVAETKIATVDLLLLVRNHPNYDSNKELMLSTDKDYQKKLDGIKAEGEKLQAEGKKLAEQLRNPMLVAKAKSDVEEQLVALQQKLVGIEQRYRNEMMRCRQDLQDLEGRLLKTTTDDLRKRIKAYAADNKIDLVLDKNTTPYAADDFEITDKVLQAMGVDPSKAKAKDDEGK